MLEVSHIALLYIRKKARIMHKNVRGGDGGGG